jgi:hypothetical protein
LRVSGGAKLTEGGKDDFAGQRMSHARLARREEREHLLVRIRIMRSLSLY